MSVSEIQASYAEYADRLHRLEFIDRLITGRYRRDRFGDIDGKVLDVACGTGTNFRYLPCSVDLVGVDISQEMLANAEERLAALGRDGAHLMVRSTRPTITTRGVLAAVRPLGRNAVTSSGSRNLQEVRGTADRTSE